MGCREYLITQSKQRLTQRTWYIQIRKVIQSFGSFRRLNFLGNQKEGKLNNFEKGREKYLEKKPWRRRRRRELKVRSCMWSEGIHLTLAGGVICGNEGSEEETVEVATKEEWGERLQLQQRKQKQYQPLEFAGIFIYLFWWKGRRRFNLRLLSVEV